MSQLIKLPLKATLFILFLSFSMGSQTFGIELKGHFTPLNTIPEKREIVVFDEFSNFGCPHCNNFNFASKSLLKKYKGKLKINYVPYLFRGQSDLIVRLYLIAHKMGRGKEVKNAIFEAKFKYDANIFDPATVSFLARSLGLMKEFKKNQNASWVNQKLKEFSEKAAKWNVKSTPTIVLQEAVKVLPPPGGMKELINNIDSLISQLLK